jgi:hypothetical protein
MNIKITNELFFELRPKKIHEIPVGSLMYGTFDEYSDLAMVAAIILYNIPWDKLS